MSAALAVLGTAGWVILTYTTRLPHPSSYKGRHREAPQAPPIPTPRDVFGKPRAKPVA